MKLVTVEEMRRLEQAADTAGHSYATMMERAGRAVAQAIQERLEVRNKRILVLVGPGNNGGDGLVAARYLHQAGAQIACYLSKPRPDDDPNAKKLQDLQVQCFYADGDGNHKTLSKALQNADVIVDALLGTGVSRPIEGSLRGLLETVGDGLASRRGAPTSGWLGSVPERAAYSSSPLLPYVVAVDVPSGLDCDSGQFDPVTIAADLTVTFAAAKHGQLRFPGAQMIGELLVADIGIDPALSEDIQTEIATPRRVRAALPRRPLNAHKGTFGKAMIVAGSVNYTGAPYLSAAAAARVGTGLVTLAPPQPIHSIVAARLAEATYLLLPHDMGVFVPQATKVLAPHLGGYTALLLGPGLGREKQTVEFVHTLLGVDPHARSRRIGFQPGSGPDFEGLVLPPLVIDADGLNALAEAEEWWTHVPKGSILTPHPGEMARLAKMESAAVNEARISVAQEHAIRWSQVIALKGAYTVVAAPDGRIAVMPFANPALATAGTGDVLAGAVVGYLAQGLEPFDAAVCGAYVHGLAGQIVAEQTGRAGMLASDLLPALPQAIARLTDCPG